MLSEATKKELWVIAEEILVKHKDRVKHCKRMYEDFKILRGSNQDQSDLDGMWEVLECGIILHDIGISENSGPDHQKWSEKLLKKLIAEKRLDFLSDSQKEWLLYAVANHSSGVKDKSNTIDGSDYKNLCLQLLSSIDHLDHLTEEGIDERVTEIRKSRIPDFPPSNQERTEEKIIALFRSKKSNDVTSDMRSGMRNKSVFGYLVFQLLVTDQVLAPVFRFFEEGEIKELVARRKTFMENHINNFLGEAGK